MLKFLILFVLIGLCYARDSVQAPSDAQSLVKAALKKCITKDDNISLNEVLQLVGEGKYKEDPGFQKIVHCTYVNSGFADPSGKVHDDKVINVFHGHEEFAKAVKMCNIAGANPVDTTFLSFKCFMDNIPYLITYTID